MLHTTARKEILLGPIVLVIKHQTIMLSAWKLVLLSEVSVFGDGVVAEGGLEEKRTISYEIDYVLKQTHY